MQAIGVSVLGKSILEGATSTYNIYGREIEVTSPLPILTLLFSGKETGIELSKLLFIAPHSLQEDYLEKTEDFIKYVVDKMNNISIIDNETNMEYRVEPIDNGDFYQLKISPTNGENSGKTVKIRIQPVQVSGIINDVAYKGDPRTTFSATFAALQRMHGDCAAEDGYTLVFDTTHGWNHILLLAHEAAKIFATLHDMSIEYYTSPPAGISEGGEHYEIDVLPYERLADINSVVKISSQLTFLPAFSPHKFALKDLEKILRIIEEEYEDEEAKMFSEFVVESRKLLCALSTNNVTYLHYILYRLPGILDDVNCKVKYIEEEILGHIVDNKIIRGEEIEVAYNMNRPFITYPLLKSLVNMVVRDDLKFSIKPIYEKVFDLKGRYSNSKYSGIVGNIIDGDLIEEMIKYYENIGATLNLAVLEHEAHETKGNFVKTCNKYFDELKNKGLTKCKPNIKIRNNNKSPNIKIRNIIAHAGVIDALIKCAHNRVNKQDCKSYKEVFFIYSDEFYRDLENKDKKLSLCDITWNPTKP